MNRQETGTAPARPAKTPRRRWRLLAVVVAGPIWLGAAGLWLGLALGYDFALVERYDEQGKLNGPEMTMRYGWPWPYLAAHRAVPFRAWPFWADIEEVLWFSAAVLAADVALWLLGVAAWGWLLLRWCRSRRPWQFRLSSFLLTLGIAALLLWPFVSTRYASSRGREAAQRLARLEFQDAGQILHLILQDPLAREKAKKGKSGLMLPPLGYTYIAHEERFLWFWTLLGMQTPQWAKVPMELTAHTFKPRRALALAGRIPTLRSVSIYVLREEDMISLYPLRISDASDPPLEKQPPGISPEEARARIAAILDKHDLADPPVRAADLEHLHQLPQLQYVRLSLLRQLSPEEVAVLVRLPRVTWLFLNHRDRRQWIVLPQQLPEFLKMPRLRSLAVAVHHEAVPEKIKQQFQRRGVELGLLLRFP